MHYDTKGDDGSRDAIPLAAAGRLLQPGEEDFEADEPADDALADRMAELALEDELPIVVMDAMLPGQTLDFVVSDEVHKRMITRCLDSESQAFGMLGVDPQSNRPLYTGVEAEIIKMEVPAPPPPSLPAPQGFHFPPPPPHTHTVSQENPLTVAPFLSTGDGGRRCPRRRAARSDGESPAAV